MKKSLNMTFGSRAAFFVVVLFGRALIQFNSDEPRPPAASTM